MSETGPLDDLPFPRRLTAHVVDPETRAVHGYDLERDLARHYRFTETAYLAITGELPREAAGRALDIALTFLASATVAEAPGHAAVLARVCAADLGATLAIAATALSEQAHDIVRRHSAWIAWMSSPASPVPQGFEAADDAERQSSSRLRDMVAGVGLDLSPIPGRLSRTATILSVLHACGLGAGEQMAVFLVVARLPCVMAEALAVPLGSFPSYPMHLPPFHLENR